MRWLLASLAVLVLATPAPAAAQETSADFSGGSMIVGYDGRTCDVSLEGSIRYDSSGGSCLIEFCAPGGDSDSIAESISAGEMQNACGVRADGNGYCWGSNNDRSGANSGGPWNTPTQVTGTWKQMTTGGRQGCGIKSDDTTFCWGQQEYGALGNGSTSFATSGPVQVSNGGSWMRVVSGYNHTCGIKTDGTLWCWGRGSNGRLGDGSTSNNSVPGQVGTDEWSDVAAGNDHTCGVETDGTLWCWGTDGSGQLGNGAATTTDQSSPVQESTGSTAWRSVSAGTSFTCATRTDNTLWCWGSDSSEKLGDGTGPSNQTSPVQIAGSWSSVSAGDTHACGIKTDGSLWCWGDDTSGRLGNGATTGTQSTPSQESTLATDWASVTAGDQSSCAVKTNGAGRCWGENSQGAVGDASWTDRTSPTTISGSHTWIVTSGGGAYAWQPVCVGN